MSRKAQVPDTETLSVDESIPAAPQLTPAFAQKPLSGIYVKSGIAQGDYVSLEQDSIKIGRNNSCDIVLHDSFVSLEHARIFDNGDAYYIEDLNSTNGTVVDGVRIHSPLALKLGSKITLGKNTLEAI